MGDFRQPLTAPLPPGGVRSENPPPHPGNGVFRMAIALVEPFRRNPSGGTLRPILTTHSIKFHQRKGWPKVAGHVCGSPPRMPVLALATAGRLHLVPAQRPGQLGARRGSPRSHRPLPPRQGRMGGRRQRWGCLPLPLEGQRQCCQRHRKAWVTCEATTNMRVVLPTPESGPSFAIVFASSD